MSYEIISSPDPMGLLDLNVFCAVTNHSCIDACPDLACSDNECGKDINCTPDPPETDYSCDSGLIHHSCNANCPDEIPYSC